jgi:hypothetical protein
MTKANGMGKRTKAVNNNKVKTGSVHNECQITATNPVVCEPSSSRLPFEVRLRKWNRTWQRIAERVLARAEEVSGQPDAD